jgi:hypothetical protein
MLSDLKRKDPFYETYVKTSEELSKLREAHVVLISMIKNNHVTLKGGSQSTGGLLGGVDNYEIQIGNPKSVAQTYRGGAGPSQF